MIKQIMRILKKTGTDQISFRKVGHNVGAHLNIQIETINDFNANGYAMITDKLLSELMNGNVDEDGLDEELLSRLYNDFNYGMNTKESFYEECCPNCGAQTGEFEVQMMGGNPDRNKRSCLRCGCTWYGYEHTAILVTEYIKRNIQHTPTEKKDDMKT